MFDLGATLAGISLVNVLAGMVSNQATMAAGSATRLTLHAVQCFWNSLKKLDAKDNHILYRALATAHWQAIQQTAGVYARRNRISLHADDNCLGPLRKAIESVPLLGGLDTLRSATDGKALDDLIAECDQRISNLRSGPPQVPALWAAKLASMFQDLTTLVAQNKDSIAGPAPEIWDLLQSDFPSISAYEGYREVFASYWHDCICVNFQILTNTAEVSQLLTNKLFAEIRVRPEGPRIETAKLMAALNDVISPVLKGMEMRIVAEIRASGQQVVTEFRKSLQEFGSDFRSTLDLFTTKLCAGHRSFLAEAQDRRMGLGNIHASVLGRDHEAELLLAELDKPGPGSISITAPPGFGKSALFHLAVRKALDRNPPDGGLTGIALLDARLKEEYPGLAHLARCLGRMAGLDKEGAAFAGCSADNPADLRRFFDFLHRMGRVWFVVDNAEAILRDGADSVEFLPLLNRWCDADHEAKLLILTSRQSGMSR